MIITYDDEVDTLYLRFVEKTVTTQHVAKGISVDYTAEGQIAGIEILDVRKRIGDPEDFLGVVLGDMSIAQLLGKSEVNTKKVVQER